MTGQLLRVATGSFLAIALTVGGTASVSAGSGPEAIANAGKCVSSPRGGTGSSRFTVEFLAAASEDGARTAVVSPLSVEAVLAMAGYGASASFRHAVRRLFVEGAGDWKPACRLAAVLNAAAADEDVELNAANGAFAARALDMFPAFRAALEDRFGARVARLDFSQPRAIETINAWVETKTSGMIPRLLANLPPETVLVLVNALHFKGKWAHAFDPVRTTMQPFRLGSGELVERATMVQALSARYRADESFEALELPYGNGDFTLTVVVPRPGVVPPDAIARLRDDPSWFGGAGFKRAVGKLHLPRLNLSHTGNVLPLLKRLGLAEALGHPDAFSGIAAPAPKLSQVIHAARLALDEEGTEAGAATAAVFTKSLNPLLQFDLRVDRPFALAVRTRDGGDLLFAAWVDDPGHSTPER